ncbi:amino acid adenylation domain-containing protein [Streptomyces sp. NPDC048514]|uniref:amino acid adenylation domain-containing protein n=1 Tax=Streptomyces sp. NPDC048514 TaxID=3365564 RepID=UPI003724ADF7
MRITLETMRRAVADILDEPPGAIGDQDDLTALGLDSMAIMSLAAQWRGEGAEIRFGDLVERPRLAHWWELVAQAAGTVPHEAGAALPGAPPSAAVDESAPFPLAPMQHAYWVGRADGQVLGGVGGHFYFEFDGPALDPDRLDAALRALTSRHAMFRARFLPDGTQRISGPPTGLARVHDLRDGDAEQVGAELDRLRARLSHQRLDAAAGPLLDVHLTLLPGGTSRLHLDVDMLVCDAMSFRIALADLARGYDEPGRQPGPLGYSYPRYLADRAARPPARLERDRAYWAGRLPTLPGGPQLPLAAPPERLHRPRTGRRTLWLTPERRERLASRAREHGISPAMALATCYAEVLATWSAEKRFLLNLPLFDRDPVHADVAALVGDFTSLLLLTADATREESFAERARRLNADFRESAGHSACPGTDVLRDLARSRPGAAVAPVVFTSALSMGELFADEVRRVLGEPVWLSSQTPQVWMDLQAVEHDGGIRLIWEAVEDLFPAGLLDDMADALRRLLDGLTAPDADWADPLPDLLPAAQRQVRAAVNATDRPCPEHTLHEPFFTLARQEPQRPALLWADGSLTRADLAGQALALAGLLRSRGVAPGDTVMISLPKGPRQIVAVLGVLAAGGTYVPAGIDQPEHRRRRIEDSCGARLTVTEALLQEACTVTPLPGPVPVPPEQTAYILYTSGSTGEPKGVEVPHRSAVNTVSALNERFGIGPGDRALAVSALDFDLSVYDVFGPLSAGGAVVCVRQEERRDARAWLDLVRGLDVTVVNCVPTLLQMLLEATEGAGATAGIRVALLGGDRIAPDLAARARRVFPSVRFAGLGGTTETAIHSTVQEVGEAPAHWTCVPYGVPLPGQRCRVVDPRGRDCPDRVPGELWIGGASVARGYRGDPTRTADRFVEHAGLRWYRTGDLARYLPDGTLEFLGRADFQLKVRGHRIEPGEIEAALRDHPAIAAAAVLGLGDPPTHLAAAVVLREPSRYADGRSPQADEPAPHADVPVAGVNAVSEPAGGASVSAGEPPVRAGEPSAPGGEPAEEPVPSLVELLREHLADRLPPAMIPDVVTVLDALPLNTNGKVDRGALRDLVSRDERPTAGHQPPQGVVETQVAELWAELLGVERVGRDDGFFELGGDSLLATRLLTRLRAAGLHGADLGRLFAAPMLRDFAAGLDLGRPTRLPPVTPDPDDRYEPFPATDIQRAYWLGRGADFTLGGVGSYWYWEFDGRDVDLKRLEDAWNRLVERHEMMRAVFDEDGNQRILDHVPPIAFDVTEAPPGDAEETLRTQRAGLDHRVFDVTRWPLFHISATRYDADRTRIRFGFDYIVLDALSIMTIFWELSRLYEDPACALPSLDVSFRDYVLQAAPDPEEVAADRAYWTGRLPELPRAPALPLGIAPEQAGPPRFTRREFFLPPAVWQALTRTARGTGLTPSAVLAAAFADVLAAWSAQPEVTVNLTLFDRREVHPDINNIVGDFTSLLLVGHRPADADGWADAARRFQQQIWEGLQHSSVSALWVLRELARRTGAAEVAMPVVFTSTLGVSDRLADLTMPFGEQVYGLSQTPQVWLDCQVVERDGGVSVNWDAVEELFPAGLLQTMITAYERHLTGLARADWRRPVVVELPAEQARARAEVNATEAPLSGRLLHEPFFAGAAAAPGRPALLWREGRLDHGELAERALRVAGALRAAGVGPGDGVAIVLPKGPDQITAVLGTLAAGACYVPVGVDQPPVRRARILRRARAVAVLTDVDPATDAAWPDGIAVLDVRTARTTAAAVPAPVTVPDTALAYTIFTSGSTGEPKGVETTHRAAANTVEDIGARFSVGPDDRVLALSALDFDLSVYDIFGLLGAGGALVLVEERDRREPHRWLDLLRTHRVTVWNTVPALLDMLLTAAEGADGPAPEPLRLALVSGDWVGLDLPGRLAARAPGCRLVALGGATEAAIWSNAYPVIEPPPGWPSIPYGYPLRNQCFRVADPAGRDRPDWVPGELWIGGTGVARGYRGDPERTAQQFVEHEGLRWYRTGDLGRYRPGGILEFLGRADQQVKIRGHRIELGEIEAALHELPGIGRAVACIVGERPRHRIAAFAVPAGDPPGPVALRAALAERLPGYMIPERIGIVDRLPLTANGKVDRGALAALLDEEASPVDEGPRGELETALAALFADLLGVERVGRTESFFALGGDSLTATRATERLWQTVGVRLTLREFFSAPAVEALARLIEHRRAESALIPMEEGVL